MKRESMEEWLEALAARQPTPGGGGAAALSAAISAALIGMVSIYTTGAKWEDRDADMQKMHNSAEHFRNEAVKLIKADADAFTRVGQAYKLVHDTKEEAAIRDAAIQKSLIGASEPPAQTAQIAVELVPYVEQLAELGNANVISDVAVAASNIRTALESAIVNIDINRRLISDQASKDRLKKIIDEAEDAISKANKIVITVSERIRNK